MTPVRLDRIADAEPGAHGHDWVIDVRSPAEYADDHLPGAINLPVLDDAERARVGTIYKQQSPFLARKIGAALVARNAARHIEERLAAFDGGWRPLVYCWRGGQRSGSFGTILSQIGWRVGVLEGGYKSWRRLVTETLEAPIAPPVGVLDGNTGTAKTAVLARLAEGGAQVIDLEGLARHRGSVFGEHAGGQPSQRLFEGRLARALAALDPARPLILEAESARIGALRLPGRLWRAMVEAPRIEIAAPITARAHWLVDAYDDIVADPARLGATLERLRPMHPAERIAAWGALAAAGRYAALAEALMVEHYDPGYARARARGRPPERVIATDALGPAEIDRLAGAVRAAAEALAAARPSA
ncbi:MAG: tRNA 2-selenouridine(34) synthase MnmH [Gemmobacter sp.]